MKTLVVLLFLLVGCSFTAQADQLAYLLKENAENAAKFIRTQKKIWLYCGCRERERPVAIEPEAVEVVFTNYATYYEVIVTYKDVSGEWMTAHLDLAYVWVEQKQEKKKKRKQMVTVGAVMNLEHDPCHNFPDR